VEPYENAGAQAQTDHRFVNASPKLAAAKIEEKAAA
jgi:hypothetical protein